MSTRFGNGETSERQRYQFDPLTFDAATIQQIARNRDYLVAHSADGQLTEGDLRKLDDIFQERTALRIWSEEFSGKVPLEWGEVEAGTPWHKIEAELEDPTVEMDEALIDAAIQYPVAHVVYAAGTLRKLTPAQLTAVENMDLAPWALEDIEAYQLAGLSTAGDGI